MNEDNRSVVCETLKMDEVPQGLLEHVQPVDKGEGQPRGAQFFEEIVPVEELVAGQRV
jgi:hypothetical protein